MCNGQEEKQDSLPILVVPDGRLPATSAPLPILLFAICSVK